MLAKANLAKLSTWSVGLGFLLLSCSLERRACAQASNPQSSTINSRSDANVYGVSGTVVNSVSGEPIRRAAVNIFSGSSDRVALTDAAGHFEFVGIAEGSASLTVTKPGFFDAVSASGGRTVVQVTADSPPVVLRMAPAAVVVGRVTSRDEPLEGFIVHLVMKQINDGRRVWANSPFQDRTDDDGDFRIANVPADSYYVWVDSDRQTAPGEAGASRVEELGYPAVFYPGVSEFGEASPLELSAGREAQANFALAAEPIYQVSGEIPKETPALSLLFERRSGDGHDFSFVAPVQDGKFQASLLAGSYRASGFTGNGADLSTLGASVIVRSDSANVHVVLAPEVSVPVTLRTEKAEHGPQEELSESGPMQGISIQLIPKRPSIYGTSAYPMWKPMFSAIGNVESGVYTFHMDTSGSWWVKSAQCGGVDLLSDDLTVAEGTQPPPIEVTLRNDAASVSGTVKVESGVDIATVLLVQTRGRRNLVKTVAAIRGQFAFSGVAPGEYLLLAIDHAEQLEYTNPDVLNPYLSAAARVSLQSGGTASVNLSLTPLER